MTPPPVDAPAVVDASSAGLHLALVALTLAAVALLLWALAERRRYRIQAEHAHGWREAYAWLLATAACPLCGSRMEPGSATAHPVHEPHREDLR